MIDWWRRWRLARAELDFLEALGRVESIGESWCQYTEQEAQALKCIAEGKLAYYRLKLGLNPFSGTPPQNGSKS